MSRSLGWSVRLLVAFAAGFAAVPLVLFTLYWGGFVLIGDIPSDAVVSWAAGTALAVTALLVLWKTRPAPASEDAREDRRHRRRVPLRTPGFAPLAIDTPPKC